MSDAVCPQLKVLTAVEYAVLSDDGRVFNRSFGVDDDLGCRNCSPTCACRSEPCSRDAPVRESASGRRQHGAFQ